MEKAFEKSEIFEVVQAISSDKAWALTVFFFLPSFKLVGRSP